MIVSFSEKVECCFIISYRHINYFSRLWSRHRHTPTPCIFILGYSSAACKRMVTSIEFRENKGLWYIKEQCLNAAYKSLCSWHSIFLTTLNGAYKSLQIHFIFAHLRLKWNDDDEFIRVGILRYNTRRMALSKRALNIVMPKFFRWFLVIVSDVHDDDDDDDDDDEIILYGDGWVI